MSLVDRAGDLHHSPAVWGLIGAGLAAGVVLVGTVGWNVAQHFADDGVRLPGWLRL